MQSQNSMQVTLKKCKDTKRTVKYEDDQSFAYFDRDVLKKQFGEVPAQLEVTLRPA